VLVTGRRFTDRDAQPGGPPMPRTHLLCVPPPQARPAGRAEFVQEHDERDAIQAAPDDLPVIDIRSL
jgi:hypothetical protein